MADDLDEEQVSKIAPELRKARLISYAITALTIGLASMALHAGPWIGISLVALLVYWALFMFIVFLRGEKPTHLDILFARLGFPAIWAVVFFVYGFVSKIHLAS